MTASSGQEVIVVNSGDEEVSDEAKNGRKKFRFACQTPEWDELFSTTRMFHLRSSYRQTDVELAKMLNSMRCGTCSDSTEAAMKALDRKVYYEDGIAPTHLYVRADMTFVKYAELQ